MKRSAEMYKYCLTNNFWYGLTANWAMKHFLLIENSLILLMTFPILYIITPLLKESWVFCLTQKNGYYAK